VRACPATARSQLAGEMPRQLAGQRGCHNRERGVNKKTACLISRRSKISIKIL